MKIEKRPLPKQKAKPQDQAHGQQCNYDNNYYGDQVCVVVDRN